MSELQRLRDRVAELEDLIGASDRPIYSALGLTPMERKLLHVLVKRETVSKEFAYSALYGDRPEIDQPQDVRIVPVYMVKLRKKLKPHDISIETDWGHGWRMLSVEKRKLQSILQQLSDG